MISVIICTFNRAEKLRNCLQSFTKIISNVPWELIVVNNNCTDDTQDVIKHFQTTTPLPLVSCFEENKGLGNARNAGLLKARYELVAYTDDDCYPGPDYLECIRHNFEHNSLGFLGGRVMLHDPTDLPLTIKESLNEEFFEPGRLIKPGEIHGANFCFRKNVLEQVKGFDPLFGAGTHFPCEDIDTLAECLRLGFKGKYAPDIVVHHAHGRKSQADFEKQMQSYDIGRGAFFTKRIVFKPGQRMKYGKYWFYRFRNQSLRTTWAEFKAGCSFLMKTLS